MPTTQNPTPNLDFSELSALFIGCSLKKNPSPSNTEGLMQIPMSIMRKHGVSVELIRAVDYDVPAGMSHDMTTEGWDRDEWPQISEKVMAADILVIGTPIWLGDKSSVCTKVIERIYADSSELNDKGQSIYYGKVGGCVITGNEDGVKHCSMNILFSLEHMGYTIPPQAETGWIGEIGPGPSYLDKQTHAADNDFTNRSATFMAWNLMHMAQILKLGGGIPAYGNQQSKWKEGERFDFEKPE